VICVPKPMPQCTITVTSGAFGGITPLMAAEAI
jgi:hypothetical protein